MNTNMLKGKIREKSMTQGDVSESIGMHLSTFNAKLNEHGNHEFTLNEIKAIAKTLELSTDMVVQIFLT